MELHLFHQTLQKMMESKPSYERKWHKPAVWDSDRNEEYWPTFKKLLKASLYDVGLDYLLEEGAKESGVNHDKWIKDNKSLYSKLLSVLKGMAQDVMLQQEGNDDCGYQGWIDLCGRFENISTKEKRVQHLKELVNPEWDVKTDPDKMFHFMRDKQQLINKIKLKKGEIIRDLR